MDKLLARQKELFRQKRAECEDKDRELEALRRQVRGVEVHDVDAGVSTVEERGDAEPPAKRVRREQDAGARVSKMYMDRLVQVKKEQVEEGARRQAALKSEVDAEVREALTRVARAMECACCFETLGEGSVALLPCGHTYCNRASSCASAQVTECPECRQAVAGRVALFGALANVEAVLAGAGGGAMCG